MSVQEFRDHEIARLERSGWAANAPLREVLDVAGLRPPAQVVAECLDETADSGAAGAGGGGGSTGGRWERAECAVTRLREHFASFRFAGDVDYGLLAVPDAARFDTRGAVDPRIRCGQRPDLVEDLIKAPVERFEVDGVDARAFMTRQVWGARLLQCPPGVVPDSDDAERWTFTIFPAEGLVDGRAVSGTVLKKRVRFRLGKANRGIGSARVSPALPLM